MTKRAYRYLHVLTVLLTAGMLFASYYFEYIGHLQPCPLCLMQRYCVFGLFFAGMLALGVNTFKRALWANGLQLFFATAGAYFAGRQLWLQSLPPDQTPACLPDLSVLIRYFPWQDVAQALFWGAGDCAEISWQWLGLSMPAWTLIYFALMIVLNLLLIKMIRRSQT